jgi:hypothetical protein
MNGGLRRPSDAELEELARSGSNARTASEK